MTWPTLTVDSWADFTRLAEGLSLGPARRPNYLARGQADEHWGLAPSLNRHLPSGAQHDQVISIEKELQAEFVSQATNHMPAVMLGGRYNQLQKWAVMQHHGAPTRLLDWTLSPYVAAYFAVDSFWESSGAIWLFHTRALEIEMRRAFAILKTKKLTTLLFDEEAPAAIEPWYPGTQTARMAAQQGCFTIAANPLTSHEDAIGRLISLQEAEPEGEFLRKVIIPTHLKLPFLRQLRMMNITAKALFPGIDGLGRSTTELLRLSSYVGHASEPEAV